MKTNHALTLASLALGPVLLLTPLAQTSATTIAIADLEIGDDDVASLISVADVSRRGDTIAGTVINRSGDEVRDIRLLIDVAFLWKNEVHPGDDSPGRSAVLTVAGPIEPRGQRSFEFTPTPPLAERSDGRYADPQVHVLGYEFVSAR